MGGRGGRGAWGEEGLDFLEMRDWRGGELTFLLLCEGRCSRIGFGRLGWRE